MTGASRRRLVSRGPWPVEEVSGPPAAVLGREADLTARRLVVCRPTGGALVLGSTQPEESIDAEAARARGLELVRRRSGGGAVLVRPGELVWVEAVLPAGDALWEEDLGRSFLWLGRAWARALDACGLPGASVHEGPMERTRWSRTVCFAGRGPGEVSLDGRKAVGLSQRRRRDGAVFQCAVLLTWDAMTMAALLAVSEPAERLEALRDLSDCATAVRVDPAALVAALAASLPSS